MNAHHTPASRAGARRSVRVGTPTKVILAVAISAMFVAGSAMAQGQGRAQAPGQQDASGITEERFAANRLLVQPRAGLSDSEFEKVIRPVGGQVIGRIPGLDVRIVQLPLQASEKAVAALLRGNPHVQFAELDRQVLIEQLAPNDPRYSNQWHLPKIGADHAWSTSTGSGVVVAIIDSGIDGAHPDLAQLIIPGWNFYGNNADTSDPRGHGTAVAGMVSAVSDNGIGIAGLASGAKLMPVRVSDENGYAYWSTVANALTYAANNGARVANISFSAWDSLTVINAAQYMKSKGGVVSMSAGNNGALNNPAPTEALMVVSATTSSDAKASWSNYGNYVDLSAPGASVHTTNRGGGYGNWSGTSFSAPTVAGVAALVMSANPRLTPDEVQGVLYSTAVDLGAAGKDTHFGHGRVNAGAAVVAAASTATTDTLPPTVSVLNPQGGTAVSGLVTVDVSAKDNVAVSRVDLHVNGKKLASALTAPYGFSWDSTKVGDGAATVTAYAFDAAGNYSADAVSVTVQNVSQEPEPIVVEPAPEPEPTPAPESESVADTVAPEPSISSPSDGSKVNGNVNVNASATDNVGVVRMRLYHNGSLMASANGGTVSFRWNARQAASGQHTWKVEADDAAGNTGTRSVTVSR